MADDRPTGASGWMLDELGHVGRENLDSDHVARDDRKEDADAEAEVALLRDLGLGADSTLVDLGAGTGQVALAAAAARRSAAPVRRAFGFDPSEVEERIEAWCASYPEGSADGDEWVRADVEEHVRDEHSTFTWLLEPMIERSGFRIEDASPSEDGLTAAYVARAV